MQHSENKFIFDRCKVYLMTSTMKKYFLFILYSIVSSISLAQEITHEKIVLDKIDKKIHIHYTLENPKDIKYLYNISVFFSKGADTTYKPLQHLEGDFGKYMEHGDKEIRWNYLAEDSLFDGQEFHFKLKASMLPDPKFLGGPEQVWRSALLPGWGNTRVRYRHKLWYLNSVATFSLIGAGVFMRLQSESTFDDYLAAQTREEARSLFDKSDRQRRTGGILLLAGGAVWLTDIIRVAIKGKKNNKLRREIKEFKENQDKNKPQLGLMYDYFDAQPTIGLRLKF